MIKLSKVIKKFYNLLTYCAVYFTVGFHYSITGTTLQLLEWNTGESSAIIALLFTFRGVGLIISSFFTGIIFKLVERKENQKLKIGNHLFSHHSIMFFFVFIQAGCLLIIPIVSNFVILCSLMFLIGFCTSFVEIGCFNGIIATFKKKADGASQILQGFYGLGGLTFPLIMVFVFSSFEAKSYQLLVSYGICGTICYLPNLLIIFAKNPVSQQHTNITKEVKKEKIEHEMTNIDSRDRSTASNATIENSDNELPLSIGKESSKKIRKEQTIVKQQQEKYKKQGIKKTNSTENLISNHENTPVIGKRTSISLSILKIFLIFCIGVLKLLFIGNHIAFSSLIFSFGKRKDLGNDSNLAILSSCFYITFTACRFIFGFVGSFIKPLYVLSVAFFGCNLIFIFFIIFSNSTIALWICTILFGIFSSPCSSCILLLLQSNFNILLSPLSTSIIMFLQYIGEMSIVTVISFFADDNVFGPNGILYLNLFFLLLCSVLFIVTVIFGFIYKIFNKKILNNNKNKTIDSKKVTTIEA